MQSIDLKLSEIIPYERNPRFNDDAVDAIAKSIAEFGFLNPIVVDSNHVIICGHTRFKAAQKLGLVSVPVIVADSLSEDQVKAYRIADNKTSELATWDYGQLVSEIRDLEEQNYDLSNLGFSEDVLNDILSHNEEDFLVMGETAPDALPELDMSCEPISKHGEVYELGDHLLFCGDLNRAKQTSVMFGSGDASLYLARVLNWSESVGDTLTFASQHLQGAFYVMSDDKDLMNVRMCCDSCGLTFHESLLWLKSNFRLSEYQYQIQHEPIIYGWKEGCGHKWYSDRKQCNLLEYNNAPSGEVPVAMLIYLIRNSSASGEIVLNTFSNTGSAVIACEQTRRKCRCFVETARAADMVRRRWAEFVSGVGCNWKNITPVIGKKSK